MPPSPLLTVKPLGFFWDTVDPFLFCVHHDDAYPAGNDRMGPAASLAGRDLGQDFTVKDGWRMYHGKHVPGFPGHPHRGFETVTVARRGFIDHSDSLGAAARFGRGDTQWLTAGGGIVHSEMFPLLDREAPNPVELFQIWLNLPSADKMAPAHFSMLWAPTIPRVTVADAAGRRTELVIVAGRFGEATPPAPPPRSWASRPDTDVAIWTLRMDPGATFELPAAQPGTNRTLYYYSGDTLRMAGQPLSPPVSVRLRPDQVVPLENGPGTSELLLLQGRPIGEPVASDGPFVMNTQAEIQKAYADYQRTRYGGWPWPDSAPVHARDAGRFARHADGTVDRQE